MEVGWQREIERKSKCGDALFSPSQFWGEEIKISKWSNKSKRVNNSGKKKDGRAKYEWEHHDSSYCHAPQSDMHTWNISFWFMLLMSSCYERCISRRLGFYGQSNFPSCVVFQLEFNCKKEQRALELCVWVTSSFLAVTLSYLIFPCRHFLLYFGNICFT